MVFFFSKLDSSRGFNSFFTALRLVYLDLSSLTYVDLTVIERKGGTLYVCPKYLPTRNRVNVLT